jgi:hypothetical protein
VVKIELFWIIEKKIFFGLKILSLIIFEVGLVVLVLNREKKIFLLY